jgi:hypothetical protein
MTAQNRVHVVAADFASKGIKKATNESAATAVDNWCQQSRLACIVLNQTRQLRHVKAILAPEAVVVLHQLWPVSTLGFCPSRTLQHAKL